MIPLLRRDALLHVPLFCLLALAFCSVPALASQQEPTREELLQTVQHIQRLAKSQQVELDAAHENEKTLQGHLTTAQTSLIKVQTEINALAQHDANATADKEHILKKYHFLKMLACAIAAAAAIFGVMQLTAFIPTALAPYKIYLYAAAGLGAATLVATLL